MYEITNEGIDWDRAFGFQLAERDMNGPLIRNSGAQAVIRQVGALADAHAGVAEQQEDVSAQVVAAEQLLLQTLILLCNKRSWQTLRCARDIFAPHQVGEFRKSACPCQFVEGGAKSDEPGDAGRGCKGRSLRTQVCHPSEGMRIAAQLLETGNFRVLGG